MRDSAPLEITEFLEESVNLDSTWEINSVDTSWAREHFMDRFGLPFVSCRHFTCCTQSSCWDLLGNMHEVFICENTWAAGVCFSVSCNFTPLHARGFCAIVVSCSVPDSRCCLVCVSDPQWPLWTTAHDSRHQCVRTEEVIYGRPNFVFPAALFCSVI